MAVEAVVFDVGETLVDETGMWARVAEAGGVTPFTLMAGLGATIALGRPHDDVWELLGIEQPPGSWTMDDWYPDARPCLERLRAAGYRVCACGNTPAFVEQRAGAARRCCRLVREPRRLEAGGRVLRPGRRARRGAA